MDANHIFGYQNVVWAYIPWIPLFFPSPNTDSICGHIIHTATQGALQFPDYPYPYPISEVECQWRIEVSKIMVWLNHTRGSSINTLRPRQDGRHFPDDIFKSIFLNKNVLISIKISLKFVPRCPINNIPALVQIMDWCRPGDNPLSEPMMVSLSTHICVTRPQWVMS